MQLAKIQLFTWENKTSVIQLEITITAFICGILAFFCGRYFLIYFSHIISKEKLQKYNNNNKIIALLMLFPQLPELADVICKLEKHIPKILKIKNHSISNINNSIDHVFVHLLLPDNLHVDSSLCKDGNYTPHTYNNNNNNNDIKERILINTPEISVNSLEVLNSEIIIKKSKKSRFSRLLGRKNNNNNNNNNKIVEEIGISPPTPSKKSNFSSSSIPNNNININIISDKKEFNWECLVQQEAAKLMNQQSIMTANNNNNIWDAHYLKIPISIRENNEIKNGCGGILLRVQENSIESNTLLQIIIKEIIEENVKTVSSSNKESNNNILLSSKKNIFFFFIFNISNIIRKFIFLFFIITLHIINVVKIIVIYGISYLSERNKNNDINNSYLKYEENLNNKELIFFPPQSLFILHQITEKINQWIGPINNKLLKISVSDVAMMLVIGTVGRLLKYNNNNNLFEKETSSETNNNNNNIKYGRLLYFLNYLSLLNSWLQYQCNLYQLLPIDSKQFNENFIKFSFMNFSFNSSFTTSLKEIKEKKNKNIIIDRLINCLENRIHKINKLFLFPIEISNINSFSNREKEVKFHFCGQQIQSLYGVTNEIFSNCMITECENYMCSTLWLPQHLKVNSLIIQQCMMEELTEIKETFIWSTEKNSKVNNKD